MDNLQSILSSKQVSAVPTFMLGRLASQGRAQLSFSRIVFTTLTRVPPHSNEFLRKWKLTREVSLLQNL